MTTTVESKKTKPSLGRGLSALLGESLEFEYSHKNGDSVQTQMVPLSAIRAGKFQPRRHFCDEKLQTLVDSIREKGIIQPLVIRPINEEKTSYEIIAGERRWRAARTLNFDEVPAIIKDCNDQEALETALIENIQRDDLSPIEEGEAYQRLLDEFSYTQEQLAKSVGKSRSHVANTLRLNTLPPHIKEMINEGKISAGHARTLINNDNIDAIVESIIDKKLSVREAELLTKKARLEIPPSEMDEQTQALERQLSDSLGLKVSLKIKKTGGILSVFFNSYEEIDDLLDKLRSACTEN